MATSILDSLKNTATPLGGGNFSPDLANYSIGSSPLSINQPSQPVVTPAPIAPTPAAPTLNSIAVNPTPSATSIQNAQPMAVPAPTQPTSTGAAATIMGTSAGLNNSLADIQKQQEADAKKAADEVAKSKTGVQALIDKYATKGDVQAKYEEDAKLADSKKLATDLSTEYQTRQLAYNSQYESILNNPSLSADQQARQIDVLAKSRSYDMANLAIRQAIATNQYNTAKELVDHKVDLEFGDLKDQIGYQMQFLKDNQDTLTSKEKSALDLQIQQNTREYTEKTDASKRFETTKIDAMKTAKENGAPQSVIQAIQDAPDTGSAIAAMGQYGRDALDDKYKNAQIDNIYSEIAKRNADAVTAAGIDPVTAAAYAAQYASTGNIPNGVTSKTFGVISQIAKEAPKQPGEIVSNATGIKTDQIPSPQQEDYGRLYNIINMTAKLKELDKQRIGGVVGGSLGKVFGSDVQGEYLTLRKSITDEISRMQTGAALTDSEQQFYTSYLPGRFSEALFLGQNSESKISNFEETMNDKLKNSLANNGLSIYGYSKVNLGGKDYTVGEIIKGPNGESGRVNPDGTITLIK